MKINRNKEKIREICKGASNGVEWQVYGRIRGSSLNLEADVRNVARDFAL